MISCSFFTGRIADDPNYVSGLQIVVMIPIAAPVIFCIFMVMVAASAAVFLTSVLIYHPPLTTAATRYSMNNLVISYVIAIAFSYIMDRIRFDSFMKTKKIELKNIEIEAQIKRINELKTQQDGDYFLTSQLLLAPLAMNDAVPSRIRVEFLTEQKKKFQFKHWQSEIGGDISSSNTVYLRNKKYVAFMNGDAMGKSIQGAGGVLFGTVFKSFLHRTQNDELSRFMFPEQWLRDCYEELHHVMISFDGRMLVSAVIGLIDEESGYLYIISTQNIHGLLFCGMVKPASSKKN